MTERLLIENDGPSRQQSGDGASFRSLTVHEVRALVPARVEVPPATGAYKALLAATALATILLPLVYLALVAAVAYGLFWHVTSNVSLVAAGEMRGKTFAAPLVIGGVLLFFLLKPLIAPRREPRVPCTLTPRDEPTLHAFVTAIAEAVGAQVPQRIDVDVAVNASASFRRGWRSFGGGDLVLTLGTPLIEGMTLAELAGVLAHEFGHFRQGWGMRASFAIHTVNAWLDRAVNGRDRWDDRLRNTSGFAGFLLIARAGVWLTRRILWLLMRIGMRLAAALSRRMELDADEHELALVGSDTLASAMRTLVLLDAAHSDALEVMNIAWKDGQVPDQAPALVRACRARQTAEFAHVAVQSALDKETTTLSTHPCVKERIAHAKQRAVAARMVADTPARALLHDASALYRRVTLWHYTEVAGVEIGPDQIVPAAGLLEKRAAAEAADAAQGRVTQGVVAYFLPLDLPRDRAAWADGWDGDDPTMALHDVAPRARKSLDRIDDADTRLAHVARCRAALDAGADPDDIKDLVLTDREPAALDATEAEAGAAIRGLRRPVDAAHAALRVILAEGRDGLDGERAARFDALALAMGAIAAQSDALEALRHNEYAANELRRLVGQDAGNEKKRDAAQTERRALATRTLADVRRAWSSVDHPFGVRGQPVPLAAITGEPGATGEAALAAADRTVAEAWAVYFRALAELCVLVEQADSNSSNDDNDEA